MFAVMGITGRVGSAVATQLLEKGKKLRGIVRDLNKAAPWQERGVELSVADYNDATALERAFRHTEGGFVMIPSGFAPSPGFPEALRMLRAVRDALLGAVPSRVVYLSSTGAERPCGIGLIRDSQLLEQQMAALTIPSAFLRAGWFMDNWDSDLPTARESGVLSCLLQPLDRSFPMVAARDVGRAVATVLLQDWSGTRVVEASGPRRYSPREVAEALSSALKKGVEARAIARELWASSLVAQGVPMDRTGPFIEMIEAFNSGWADLGASGTEKIIGCTELQTVIDQLVSRLS